MGKQKSQNRGGKKAGRRRPDKLPPSKEPSSAEGASAERAKRYLRVKIASGLISESSVPAASPQSSFLRGQQQSYSGRAGISSNGKCSSRACRENIYARLGCIVCAGEIDTPEAGPSVVKSGALTTVFTLDGTSSLAMEIMVPTSLVVDQLLAQADVNGDNEGTLLSTSQLVAMGITQEPVLTAIYECIQSEKMQQVLITRIAPKYPVLPFTGVADVYNYSEVLERLEAQVECTMPTVKMEAAYFPYAERFPSIKAYIGVISQMSEDALLWKNISLSNGVDKNKPWLAMSADKRHVRCIIWTADYDNIEDTAKTVGSGADFTLPNPTERAVDVLFADLEGSGPAVNGVGAEVARNSSSSPSKEQIYRDYKMAVSRVIFFKNAIQIALDLENDVREVDRADEATPDHVKNASETPETKEFRDMLSQVKKIDAMCEYIKQALGQQQQETCDKILQAAKLRDSIDSILQKKAGARMDLEVKIMKAGKRASESAVQRLHERHVEDLKDEARLQEQKDDAIADLTERSHYKEKIEADVRELAILHHDTKRTSVGLEGGGVAAAQLTLSEPAGMLCSGLSLIECAKTCVNEVLKIIERNRLLWEERKTQWYELQDRLGQRLRRAMEHEDAVRDAVYDVARSLVQKEVSDYATAHDKKQREAEEVALRQAQLYEAELVRTEDEKIQKKLAKEAKQRAREIKRQEAEAQRLNEQKKIAAAKRREAERAEAAEARQKREADRERERAEQARVAKMEAESSQNLDFAHLLVETDVDERAWQNVGAVAGTSGKARGRSGKPGTKAANPDESQVSKGGSSGRKERKEAQTRTPVHTADGSRKPAPEEKLSVVSRSKSSISSKQAPVSRGTGNKDSVRLGQAEPGPQVSTGKSTKTAKLTERTEQQNKKQMKSARTLSDAANTVESSQSVTAAETTDTAYESEGVVASTTTSDVASTTLATIEKAPSSTGTAQSDSNRSVGSKISTTATSDKGRIRRSCEQGQGVVLPTAVRLSKQEGIDVTFGTISDDEDVSFGTQTAEAVENLSRSDEQGNTIPFEAGETIAKNEAGIAAAEVKSIKGASTGKQIENEDADTASNDSQGSAENSTSPGGPVSQMTENSALDQTAQPFQPLLPHLHQQAVQYQQQFASMHGVPFFNPNFYVQQGFGFGPGGIPYGYNPQHPPHAHMRDDGMVHEAQMIPAEFGAVPMPPQAGYGRGSGRGKYGRKKNGKHGKGSHNHGGRGNRGHGDGDMRTQEPQQNIMGVHPPAMSQDFGLNTDLQPQAYPAPGQPGQFT